jgi:tetratricopeptide (TPR) repeat protein
MHPSRRLNLSRLLAGTARHAVVLAALMPFAGDLSAAAQTSPPVTASPPAAQTAQLDRLFADLAAAKTAMAATAIEQQIWKIWTEPDDAVLAERMRRVLDARNVADYGSALDILNGIVTQWPDYAEGWNQRATIHYLMGDDQASLADIAETLDREPRHFGALAGRAMIYLRQGDKTRAFESIVAALRIHPYIPERGLFEQLREPAARI